MPAGVFNLLHGSGAELGDALIDGTDAVSFTGSTPTGRHVLQRAARHMKKVQLELGGKSPLVVLDDADLDQAVHVALDGAFYQTGQRCTASSRLIVTEKIHDRFVARMVEGMKQLKVDHALEPGTQVGPVVDQKQLDQDLRYIEIGRKEGGKLAFGGERLARRTEGFYLQPALITDTTNQMRINREESSALLLDPGQELRRGPCRRERQLLRPVLGHLHHLAQDARHFLRHAQAGMVMVNLPTAGVDFHVPFGGRKGSSYGPREQGRYAAEFYTTVKTAYTLA